MGAARRAVRSSGVRRGGGGEGAGQALTAVPYVMLIVPESSSSDTDGSLTPAVSSFHFEPLATFEQTEMSRSPHKRLLVNLMPKNILDGWHSRFETAGLSKTSEMYPHPFVFNGRPAPQLEGCRELVHLIFSEEMRIRWPQPEPGDQQQASGQETFHCVAMPLTDPEVSIMIDPDLRERASSLLGLEDLGVQADYTTEGLLVGLRVMQREFAPFLPAGEGPQSEDPRVKVLRALLAEGKQIAERYGDDRWREFSHSSEPRPISPFMRTVRRICTCGGDSHLRHQNGNPADITDNPTSDDMALSPREPTSC